jgi:hypothetical protein
LWRAHLQSITLNFSPPCQAAAGVTLPVGCPLVGDGTCGGGDASSYSNGGGGGLNYGGGDGGRGCSGGRVCCGDTCYDAPAATLPDTCNRLGDFSCQLSCDFATQLCCAGRCYFRPSLDLVRLPGRFNSTPRVLITCVMSLFTQLNSLSLTSFSCSLSFARQCACNAPGCASPFFTRSLLYTLLCNSLPNTHSCIRHIICPYPSLDNVRGMHGVRITTLDTATGEVTLHK